MALYCRLINIKQNCKDEYVQLHQNPRQEVREVMIKHGIIKHAIFSMENLLVSVFDYSGENYIEDMKAIADHPATKSWWKIISPLQEPFPDRAPGEWWTLLEPIAAYGWDISKTGGNE